MSRILSEVLKSNEAYASNFGDKGKLALPPARGFAVLTCMDARLDPAKFAGLAEGDAHVIRNAEVEPATMPSAPWSSVTNCLAHGSSSSSTTQTAEWSFSQMMSCANCWHRVLRRLS